MVPGLAFVGVADDVLGLVGVGPGEGPLEAGGKTGAAPAPEAGVFHDIDHFLVGHGQGLLQAFVAAPFQVGVQAQGVDLVDVGQEHQFVAAGGIVAQGIGGAGQGLIVHRLAGPVVGQDILDPLRGEAAEDHFVDLHGRRDLADPQAGGVLQGEEAVRGGISHMLDAQLGLDHLHQVIRAPDVAGRGFAEADDDTCPGASAKTWCRSS